MTKKTSYTICRQCGRDFPGNPSMRRPSIVLDVAAHLDAQRQKMKPNLPYYLKTDI